MYTLKTTVWEKRKIYNDKLTKEEIIAVLSKSPEAIHELDTELSSDIDYETMENMTIEDNDGQETIELWEDSGNENPIWTNQPQ